MALVQASKAGDIAAFEKLVSRYDRKLLRVAQNIWKIGLQSPTRNRQRSACKLSGVPVMTGDCVDPDWSHGRIIELKATIARENYQARLMRSSDRKRMAQRSGMMCDKPDLTLHTSLSD
jgi:hypothetical protein